jgi:hypothetical protein
MWVSINLPANNCKITSFKIKNTIFVNILTMKKQNYEKVIS